MTPVEPAWPEPATGNPPATPPDDTAARNALIAAYQAQPPAPAEPEPEPQPAAAPATATPPAPDTETPPPRGAFIPADLPGSRSTTRAAIAPLTLEVIPERLTVSLVMATLRYRLRIANKGETALGEVTVSGDMIAAHASRPEREQLGLDDAQLPPRHHFIGLAPGESAEHTGEIRVGLAELEPIRVGSAALFVPLVRFRATAVALSGAVIEEPCVIAVGEPPSTSGAGIRPFRLDLGPRLYTAIAARKLDTDA
ncbi:MAG: hypothetical protein KGN34_12940 [Sphingomonadales bacterium]|nr:hypothetical protein [Sphingomonadales bacterium]